MDDDEDLVESLLHVSLRADIEATKRVVDFMMSLYVSDPNRHKREIAQWRLKVAK